VNGNRI